MKYLFFDIECACVFKTVAKICAFGYVLTDESFNVLEKEDILLNPKGNFHLTDRKGEKGLVLPYEYEEFKSHETFAEVYPRLKALLEDPDSLVAGHSTLNDVNYLNLETKRFHLPSFRFRFADTQLVYMAKLSRFDRQFGLEYVMQDLHVEFTPHRAVDDAYAAMRVAEALCKEEGCSFEALLTKYGIHPGSISDYEFTNTYSEEQNRYRQRLQTEKKQRERQKAAFHRFLQRRQRRNSKKTDGSLSGRLFKFSHSIEGDLELSKGCINAVYAQGGRYTTKLDRCNVFVKRPGETDELCKRAEEAEGIVVMELGELEGLLSCSCLKHS